MKNTGIIGFGNMGEAFASGLKKNCRDITLTVYDKSEERLKYGKKRYKLETASSLNKLLEAVETVIIAVKPQDSEKVLSDMESLSKGKKIISVMAGVNISYIAQRVETRNICRFMPNLAAKYGKSFTALSFYSSASEDFRKEALQIAEAAGSALVIPEEGMPAVTALSGSGMAFAFQFVHALSLGSVQAGMAYSQAAEIAAQVLEGAAETLKRSGSNPAELAARVASPAGTTIEGLAALEAKGFNTAVMDAVYASYLKALRMET